MVFVIVKVLLQLLTYFVAPETKWIYETVDVFLDITFILILLVAYRLRDFSEFNVPLPPLPEPVRRVPPTATVCASFLFFSTCQVVILLFFSLSPFRLRVLDSLSWKFPQRENPRPPFAWRLTKNTQIFGE